MIADPLALKNQGETYKIFGSIIGLFGALYGALYGILGEKHAISMNPVVLLFQIFLGNS